MRFALLCLFVLWSFSLHGQDEDYLLSVLDASCADDEVEVAIVVDFEDGNDLQGYQWGVCHDEDALDLESTDDIAFGEATVDMSFTFESQLDVDGGWTVGALFNVITGEVLEAADDQELYVVTYACLDSDDATTEIEFCDDLGSPNVATQLITFDSIEVVPTQGVGVITLVADSFLRGDVDGDGEVSALTDATALLDFAYFFEGEIVCADAADVNDNGVVQGLVDALELLLWEFQDGPEPPSPGVIDCGVDGTDDDLDCEEVADDCA